MIREENVKKYRDWPLQTWSAKKMKTNVRGPTNKPNSTLFVFPAYFQVLTMKKKRNITAQNSMKLFLSLTSIPTWHNISSQTHTMPSNLCKVLSLFKTVITFQLHSSKTNPSASLQSQFNIVCKCNSVESRIFQNFEIHQSEVEWHNDLFQKRCVITRMYLRYYQKLYNTYTGYKQQYRQIHRP